MRLTRLWLMLICVCLLPARFSIAALGEKESSIKADSQALEATTTGVRTHPTYTVHELSSESGIVREYLNNDGVVFGLAWSGRAQPDLSPLLGRFFGEYQEMVTRSATGPRIRGGGRQLRGSRVVVEKSGHMGALRGRAYLPSMLPSGMKPNEIN